MWARNEILAAAVLGGVLLAGGAAARASGVFQDPGSSTFFAAAAGNFVTDPLNNCGRPPFCNSTDTKNLFLPGFAGRDYGNIAYAECGGMVLTCPIIGRGFGRATAEGLGSNTFTAHWKLIAQAFHNCECPPYEADGSGNLAVQFDVKVQTTPPGGTVQVYFNWWAIVHNGFDPEVPPLPDDPSSVQNVSLTVNGVNIITPPSVDFVNAAALLFLPGPSWPNATGSFMANDGDVLSIVVTGDVKTEINPLPETPFENQDQSEASYIGAVTLRIDQPLPPIQNPGQAGYALFSLDIGSDTEMSDNTIDGNEVFDPGDLYEWYGPPLPVGGADGVRDDAEIFLTDYWPVAPDGPPPATGAATCAGYTPAQIQQILNERFDLDGADVIDVSLRDLIPDNALQNPIPAFASECIYSPDNLVISFDDDTSGHYAGGGCEIPVASSSPTGRTYGTTARQDELLGVDLTFVWPPVVPAAIVGATYPVLDEERLHPSLVPNPDLSDNEDDDVDALDVGISKCDVWYFSVDHEARGIDPFTGLPLDPGAIYEVLGPPSFGPVKVIDPVFHLGLTRGVDIDAFEFVWLPYCPGADACRAVLGLVFSVDEDDFLTPATDESGGLDPAMLYVSYLTGSSVPLLDHALLDDVDAIAASPRPFYPNGCWTTGGLDCNGNGVADACDIYSGTSKDDNANGIPDECEACPGDTNCDGQIDFADINPFVDALLNGVYCDGTGANADVSGNGSVGFEDINPFVALLTSGALPIPCP